MPNAAGWAEKEYKKEYGQFFTSRPVAEFMAKWVLEKQPKTILDPAVGEGIFLWEVIRLFPSMSDTGELSVTAYEIDFNMAERFQNHLKSRSSLDVRSLNLCIEDYLKAKTKNQYDAIICNPPYHKFQRIPDREQLRNLFSERYGITLSGYCNASSYFLVKSIYELAPGGRCAYIMPYEFLNTGYGETVKRYFLEKRVLKYIIKFDSSVRVFEDAITTCCILLLEKPTEDGQLKNCGRMENTVIFSEIHSLEQLNWEDIERNSKAIPGKQLDCHEKWLSYFLKEALVTNRQNLIQLKKIGRVSRGIATGSNQFFVLSKEMICRHHLSKEVCLPCVAKASDVKNLIFNEDVYRRLYEENRKVTIFNGVYAHTGQDKAYIRYGEQNGIHEGYLTSHRSPWYAIENKAPAPIWLAAFSRDRIKVVRNEMMIRNLTAFHGIYIENAAFSKEDIDLLFCWLLTPTAQKLLKENKREYGAGLDKFEPGDLMEADVLDVRRMKPQDRTDVLAYYQKMADTLDLELQQDMICSVDHIMKNYI
ncbi:MAG: SAM-dependent methyltransferase [Lachnospiraceae bacterium]|nr:SAM-dependent methyltransferase [Lachnospiraceae bacterium]